MLEIKGKSCRPYTAAPLNGMAGMRAYTAMPCMYHKVFKMPMTIGDNAIVPIVA